MKIAICLSGEPRNFHYIWHDLSMKINTTSADFYVHTWHTNNHKNLLPKHNERPDEYQNSIINISSVDYINNIKPVDYLVENFLQSEPYIKSNNNTVSSTISRMHSMFYGIQSVVSLIDTSSYDFIIRMRPDLFLEKSLDWEEITFYLNSNPYDILIPELWINIGGTTEPWSNSSGQCPDFFCIYKSNNKLFHDIYNSIPLFCGSHTDRNNKELGNLPSIPEDYLWNYIKAKGYNCVKLEMKMMLARHHLQILNNRQIM